MRIALPVRLATPIREASYGYHGNQKARLLFTLNAKDIGRPLQDLELSYRPVELRSLIEQAYAERRSITLTSVERRFPNTEVQYLDVIATPLYDEANNPLGVAIAFLDVSAYHRLQEELQRAREEIQTASEELQSSNEELETTNEELQSSNEELETTNEELQSTNEELETMVYGIIKGHKGFIDVESAAGQGTTLRFYLPV